MDFNLAREFPLDANISYLNHAAVSPWPLRTANAVKAFAEENIHLGASQYPIWEEKEIQLREKLRKLINAPSIDDIALVKNTSEGLSMIAYGINWQKGDEILISDEEFPSNRIAWQSLVNQGVTVKEIPLQGENIEASISAQFSEKTRMLAISSVQYASGLRLDLNKLGTSCRKAKVLFCVDAIQSLGAHPFNLEACHADFVVADGHKWLMAPEGLGLFYSRKSIRENMKVNEYGWHMVKDAGNYNTKDWEITPTARRFECGSPNMLGVHGMCASLSLIEDYGIEAIEHDLFRISNYLREQLKNISTCTIHEHPNPSYQSAIITFSIKGYENLELRNQLMAQGVICVNRGKGIRFSPHFYTSRESVQRAIEKIKEIIS